jgi:hypothetical protein
MIEGTTTVLKSVPAQQPDRTAKATERLAIASVDRTGGPL